MFGKCSDTLLMRHFFSAKRAVTVDECPTCAGVWLDAGELGRILSEYPSVEARRLDARAGLEETMVDDRMGLFGEQLQDQLPLDTSRSRLISSLLVAFYLIVALKTAGVSAALGRLLFCITPWACVSFPEAMGSLISPILGASRGSSPRFVWFFGWLVLALPLIQVVIVVILQAAG
jgi:Zn-finger nucleic acid-binding protein